MNINTCENFNIKDLNIDKPKKIDDVYISRLDYIIQTPKLSINKISKKISLILSEKILNFFNEFDNKIINELIDKSEDFFEEKLDRDDAEDMYKTSYKFEKDKSIINLIMNKKLSIYNNKKEQINLDSLKCNDNVICLLKCTKIIFYKNFCEPYWEILQIKLKEEKIKYNNYLFIDDENEKYTENDLYDLEGLKKIKIKQ